MSEGRVIAPSTLPDDSLLGRLAKPAILIRILLVFLAVKLVVLVALAFNSAYFMDEYWLVVHGLFEVQHLYKEIWPSKTVLYVPIFRIPHLLGEGAVEIMLLARAQMTIVAFAALALLYLVARQIGRNRLEAAFVVALVLAFRSYIEWAFSVRPEALALFYAVVGLWLVTRERRGLALCFAAGLVNGIAFLTLQKAGYFNLAFGLALVGDGLARRNLKDAFASGAALVLGWGLAVGAYYLFFMARGADFSGVVGHTLAGPALQNALTGHQVFLGDPRSLLRKVLGHDLLPYLLCAAGMVLSARHLLAMESAERRAWIFSLVIAILIFSHPAPWPYNFIMVVPFLGLWAPVALGALLARGRVQLVAVICIVVGLISFGFNARYFTHDNGFQNETARRAESLLQPGDGYFDSVGMVVNRHHAGWTLPGQVISWHQSTRQQIRAAAERGEVEYLERIFGGAPKLWILTYPIDLLGDLLAPYLDDSYVLIHSNILITGAELMPGDAAAFQNWWPGSYRLYRADGTPADAALEIDGRPVEGPVELEQARYVLRLTDSDEPLFLLPADIEGVAFDMTAPRERKNLFIGSFTF